MKISDFKYISVKWIHTFSDEPILLVSELDQYRMENRKIEYFKSGEVGIASKTHISEKTRLGSIPVPEISKINSDKLFEAVYITREDFEAQWQVYV